MLEAWRLFLMVHARLIQHMDKRLRDAGQIPLNWYDVLLELYEAPNHRLRMSDLAERVLLTRSGLTRLVDKLEGEGYLHRELDPQDRRGFYAILSDTGRDALRTSWPVYAAAITQQFADHQSDAESQTLIDVFERILESLSEE
jgi:DNA-binding MarR family transcriptional regulator